MEARLERRDPRELKPHPLNEAIYGNDPQVKREQFERLKALIKESGRIDPLTITENGMIVKGHQRCEVAVALNYATVECYVKRYSSEAEILEDLLLGNSSRILTTEQAVRQAIAWGTARNPKGIKTRDWLGKLAGMSGPTFEAAKEVIEVIDLLTDLGDETAIANLREALERSVSHAKKVAAEYTDAAGWYIQYVGNRLKVFHDGTELHPGDRIEIADRVEPTSLKQVAIRKIGGSAPMFVDWTDIDLRFDSLKAFGFKYREAGSLALGEPKSSKGKIDPQQWISCEDLSLDEQLKLSEQRIQLCSNLINFLEVRQAPRKFILALEAEIRREKALAKSLRQKISYYQNYHNAPENSTPSEPVEEEASPVANPSPHPPEGLKEGDIIETQDDHNSNLWRRGKILRSERIVAGRPGQLFEKTVFEIEWEDGIVGRLASEFCWKASLRIGDPIALASNPDCKGEVVGRSVEEVGGIIVHWEGDDEEGVVDTDLLILDFAALQERWKKEASINEETLLACDFEGYKQLIEKFGQQEVSKAVGLLPIKEQHRFSDFYLQLLEEEKTEEQPETDSPESEIPEKVLEAWRELSLEQPDALFLVEEVEAWLEDQIGRSQIESAIALLVERGDLEPKGDGYCLVVPEEERQPLGAEAIAEEERQPKHLLECESFPEADRLIVGLSDQELRKQALEFMSSYFRNRKLSG